MGAPRKYTLANKICTKCGGRGPFPKNPRAALGLDYWCKRCHNETNKKDHQKHREKRNARNNASYRQNREARLAHARDFRKQNPGYGLLLHARARARKRSLPFNIELSDIVIPETCPLLGIPIRPGKGVTCRNSPSLDRKIPERGYVKGNVWVISHRANTIKQNATPEEIELMARNLRKAFQGDLS